MTKREKIFGIIALVLAVAVLGGVFFIYKNSQNNKPPKEILNTAAENPDTQELTENNIVLVVIGKDSSARKYEISTTAKYLSQAMEEPEGLTFVGREGPYGIMLEEVNGERAIYEEDGAYWSILVDGEYGMNGIDSQPVSDGVEYSIVYTLA